ncbi:MAG: polysaccharide biosynthesis/export family protein, partial [Bacteroidota bacterium]
MQDLQQRAIQLRAAGVPESRIMEILQQELNEQAAASGESAPSSLEVQEAPGLTPESSQGIPPAAPGLDPQPAQMTEEAGPPISPEDLPVINEILEETDPESEPEEVFGHSVFFQTSPSDSAIRLSPPSGYIIGPGDVFTVTIYGSSELAESLTVTSDGAVLRRFFGKVYVSGMTFGEARRVIEQKYRRLVDARSVIEISLIPNPRTIGINIVGEVANPGFYQIPASLPAFRTIIRAGGITDIGTVRNIQVKRNGRTVHEIDIYEYLLKGTYQPFFLQEGDFVYVPIKAKVVSVKGAVNRPMKYELLEDENLAELLDYAGGL